MAAYYNEIEPYAAQWLRNLIKKGLIADGEVDTRSIVDVAPDDLRGFTQCHFFAGIGGWSHALRLAGWPDDRPLWTGSCPCQPFSSAGQQKGQADERHLWPIFFNLIRACRPPVVMGEQVAAAVGKSWLDGVSSDLEGIGYSTGAAVVPSCAVNAPHRRDRLWFVADANSWGQPLSLNNGERATGMGTQQPSGDSGRVNVADAKRFGREVEVFDAGICGEEGGVWQTSQSGMRGTSSVKREDVGDTDMPHGERNGLPGEIYSGHADADGRSMCGHWDTYQWAIGSDKKARRVKPGVRLLANGVPARVGKLRAYGNAIVPQVAAEVIRAFLEAAESA
jgi:DNA (cytosine-5)-methyltransferase 1